MSSLPKPYCRYSANTTNRESFAFDDVQRIVPITFGVDDVSDEEAVREAVDSGGGDVVGTDRRKCVEMGSYLCTIIVSRG